MKIRIIYEVECEIDQKLESFDLETKLEAAAKDFGAANISVNEINSEEVKDDE